MSYRKEWKIKLFVLSISKCFINKKKLNNSQKKKTMKKRIEELKVP
jgi:hypothetical protein